ncbi:uncharacterized protein RJT20DRAFT_156054 [Scheffersomyces xylosifermentans]|uniref:uncharacterized protein n=1 Tax=Scheffersomyces xylosifermentans TaxID=1304137 RepID=UPI00315CE1C8
MIANSTQISGRLFRSQRFMIIGILSCFITILIITSIAGHHGASKELYSKGSEMLQEKLQEYYGNTNILSGNKSDIAMEIAAEEEEKEWAAENKAKEEQKEQENNSKPATETTESESEEAEEEDQEQKEKEEIEQNDTEETEKEKVQSSTEQDEAAKLLI